jgi:hypothetical protein
MAHGLCQSKSVLHAPSPEIHGDTNERIDATTLLYGISMQSCRTRLLRDYNTREPQQSCMLRGISTPLERSSIHVLLQFRITSLLQSISILLLSDSVALIGQSLVLHNCLIIDSLPPGSGQSHWRPWNRTGRGEPRLLSRSKPYDWIKLNTLTGTRLNDYYLRLSPVIYYPIVRISTALSSFSLTTRQNQSGG